MKQFLEICEAASRAGGAELLSWRGRFAVREKAAADLVTEADFASQAKIREMIISAFPGHGFLGEEADGVVGGGRASDYRWIVDPLDGTTNYVHGLPFYSVSIALEQAGQIIVATIYDPVRDECFTAIRGRGAWLNGERVKTSSVMSLSRAVVATGFSAGVKNGADEIDRFICILTRCQALRRMGSAALNMCYVACGRMDGYFATSVKAWDVAAGVLIVAEAGGVVGSIDGGPLDINAPRLLASSTQELHDEIIVQLAIANSAGVE